MHIYGAPGKCQALSSGFLGSRHCLLVTANMIKVLLFNLLPK